MVTKRTEHLDGATFIFWMGRRELWLYAKLARPGKNHIVVVKDSEGTQYFLNGKEIAYLSNDPLKPSIILVPLPKEWIPELTQIDSDEVEHRGRSPN